MRFPDQPGGGLPSRSHRGRSAGIGTSLPHPSHMIKGGSGSSSCRLFARKGDTFRTRLIEYELPAFFYELEKSDSPVSIFLVIDEIMMAHAPDHLIRTINSDNKGFAPSATAGGRNPQDLRAVFIPIGAGELSIHQKEPLWRARRAQASPRCWKSSCSSSRNANHRPSSRSM